MSARTDLVDALTGALPDAYVVSGTPMVPDRIEAGTIAVRAYATTYAPGPVAGSVAITLTTWVLTPAVRPGDADDDLDDALADVLGVLWGLDWLTPPTAERDVMAERWNGWRITTQAFGQVEVSS